MALRNRHWRQRWDPNAQLIFSRRMRMGDNPKKPFVLPGDRLTKKQRSKLGENRVRRWFETGILEIEGWKAPEPQRKKALQAAETEEPEAPEPTEPEQQPETEEPTDAEEQPEPETEEPTEPENQSEQPEPTEPEQQPETEEPTDAEDKE